MMLLYVLFSKLVPIISIWELKIGEHYVTDARPSEAAAHPLLPPQRGYRVGDPGLRTQP